MCPVLLAFLILSSNGEYRFTQEMFSTSYNSYSPTGAVDFDKCVLHGEDIGGEISHMLRDHTSIKECVKSCLRYDQCRVASFQAASQMCFLKDKRSNDSYKLKGVDSLEIDCYTNMFFYSRSPMQGLPANNKWAEEIMMSELLKDKDVSRDCERYSMVNIKRLITFNVFSKNNVPLGCKGEVEDNLSLTNPPTDVYIKCYEIEIMLLDTCAQTSPFRQFPAKVR